MALGDYVCSRCRSRTASAAQARAEWRRTDGGKRSIQRLNACRIMIGQVYHSFAASPEQAALINAHIKDRRHAFEQRQQDRKEAEGAAEG